MPGFLISAGTTVICGHGGQVKLTPAIPPRGKVGGQPVVTGTPPSVITNCSLAAAGSPPCITTQAVTTALRVKSSGQPVLLLDSQVLSPQTATPTTVVVPQPRVKGM